MSLTITQNRSLLLQDLNQFQMCDLNDDNYKQGCSWRCFSRGADDPLAMSVANRVVKVFDQIETIPIPKTPYENQLIQRSLIFDVCNALLNRLEKLKSKEAKVLQARLEQKMLSFKYRIGQVNGGLDRNAKIDDTLHESLVVKLEQWKKNQIIYDKVGTKSTYEDRFAIWELCTYPEFASAVAKDPKKCEQFFKWAIRDNNPVSVFVEFSAVTENLEKAFLNKCVSQSGQRALKVQYLPSHDGGTDLVKVVTLPFEGRDISILDSKAEVTFQRGNWKVKIRDVFDALAKQNTEIPRFTFFPRTGIENWSAETFSYWDHSSNKDVKINMKDPKWYEKVPKWEISKEEAQKRYNDPLNNNQPVIAICATRENRNLDARKTHGYTEIALPTKSGTYYLYALGKFAVPTEWPDDRVLPFPSMGQLFTSPSSWVQVWRIVASKVQTIDFLGKMIHGIVQYPDQNLNYSQREKARLSFIFNPQLTHVVEKYLSSFNEEVLRSFQGSLGFHVGSENCSKMVQTKAETQLKGIVEVPDVYGMNFEDATSPFRGFARWNLKNTTRAKFIGWMQMWFQVLRPWRGFYRIQDGKKEWTSWKTTEMWKTWRVHSTTKIFRDQAAGVLPEKIYVN